MSDEVFIEKLNDLVINFVFTNKKCDTVIWTDTIEVDASHAVDIEFRLTRYNNE